MVDLSPEGEDASRLGSTFKPKKEKFNVLEHLTIGWKTTGAGRIAPCGNRDQAHNGRS
jgi:hypothetical protein